MNIVICGCSGSGKSTAIRRLLQQCGEPFYGFWTQKLAENFDGKAPVYLHPCREPLSFSAANHIGDCTDRRALGFAEVFNDCGVRALQNIPPRSIVVMDEVGVMENRAFAFQRAIFSILSGDYRVLLALRDRETPLLRAIRAHERSVCFCAQEANTPGFLPQALRLLSP